MSNLPQDLIFLLIFGAVLLLQFLLKHLRKPAPLTDVEAEAEAEFDPDTLARTPTRLEARQLTPVPQAWPRPAPPRAGPAPAGREARRFSRRALMGNRRAVQDAVVIGAILRPCHAYRPHDID